MKCKIKHDWPTNSYEIYFIQKVTELGASVYRQDDLGYWQPSEVDLDHEPSLTLPGDLFEALVREASEVVAPNGSMSEHLKDTREVRDRLLKIVEHKMGVKDS